MLAGPSAVTIGGLGRIYANSLNSNQGTRVYRYDSNANGNVAPDLSPALTTTGGIADGLGVDSGGHLWVAVNNIVAASELDEYANGAHGSATPLSVISGSHTGILTPLAVAVDSSDDVYVTSSAGGSASSCSGGGAVLGFAYGSSGNVAPTVNIVGTKTKLCLPAGLAIDNSSPYEDGRILVADESGHVLVFASGANGNVAPSQDITSVTHPSGVATDNVGNIYVSVPAENSIRVFSPLATGNASPMFRIAGSATNLNSPQQLFISSQ